MGESGVDAPGQRISRRGVLKAGLLGLPAAAKVLREGFITPLPGSGPEAPPFTPVEPALQLEPVSAVEIEQPAIRTGFILPDGSVARKITCRVNEWRRVHYDSGKSVDTMEPFLVEVGLEDEKAFGELAISVAGWVGERFRGAWGRQIMEARARRALAEEGLYLRVEPMDDMSRFVGAQCVPAPVSGVEVEGKPVSVIRVKPDYFYVLATGRNVDASYDEHGRSMFQSVFPRHLLSHEIKHWAHYLWDPDHLVTILRANKPPPGTRQQMTPLANVVSGIVGVVGALTARPKLGEERVGRLARVWKGVRAALTTRAVLEPVLLHDYPDESDHPPELFEMEGFDYVEPEGWSRLTGEALRVKVTRQAH